MPEFHVRYTRTALQRSYQQTVVSLTAPTEEEAWRMAEQLLEQSADLPWEEFASDLEDSEDEEIESLEPVGEEHPEPKDADVNL